MTIRHVFFFEAVLGPAEPEEPLAGLAGGGVAPSAQSVLAVERFEPLLEEPLHIRNAERLFQIHRVVLLESEIADMDVGLVDAGDDGPAAEIVNRSFVADPGLDFFERPDGNDSVAVNGERARRRLRRVHGDDVGVAENPIGVALRERGWNDAGEIDNDNDNE